MFIIGRPLGGADVFPLFSGHGSWICTGADSSASAFVLGWWVGYGNFKFYDAETKTAATVR